MQRSKNIYKPVSRLRVIKMRYEGFKDENPDNPKGVCHVFNPDKLFKNEFNLDFPCVMFVFSGRELQPHEILNFVWSAFSKGRFEYVYRN